MRKNTLSRTGIVSLKKKRKGGINDAYLVDTEPLLVQDYNRNVILFYKQWNDIVSFWC